MEHHKSYYQLKESRIKHWPGIDQYNIGPHPSSEHNHYQDHLFLIYLSPLITPQNQGNL